MNLIDYQQLCFCCHVHVFMCLFSNSAGDFACVCVLKQGRNWLCFDAFDHLFLYFVLSKVSHQGAGSVKWESHKQQFICALMLVLVFVLVLVGCLLCRAKFCLWMLAVCEMGITL